MGWVDGWGAANGHEEQRCSVEPFPSAQLTQRPTCRPHCQIAASIVLIALFMLGKPSWSTTLSHYSGYSPADLRHCAQAVHGLFLAASSSNLPASREKYAQAKYGSVSGLGCPEVLPDFLFH